MSIRTDGACFIVAANFAVTVARGEESSLLSTSATLVHGHVTGTGGGLENLRYSHAWVEVEVGNTCLVVDFSNGNSVIAHRDCYYAEGKVEPDECFRYPASEVPALLCESEEYGPWDLEPTADEETLKENGGSA